MRNLFGIISLFLFSLSFAQVASYDNNNASDTGESTTSKKYSFFSSGTDATSDTTDDNNRIGNPDAVPVDDYVPILVIIAGVLIVYYSRPKKLIS